MTTTTTTKTSFQIHAIPQEVFDRVRASGVDVSGNPVERLTATGGEPLRCCLRDEVVQIHSHNVAYGCYMFTVTRPKRRELITRTTTLRPDGPRRYSTVAPSRRQATGGPYAR